MVKLLLTLENIPKELHNNYESYYKYHHKIPINCEYLLYDMHYYKNSPHLYRDFTSKTDFLMLLNGNVKNKPTSNKSYNMGKYYIPSKDKGQHIKSEILPIKVDKFNVINSDFLIESISFYSNAKHKFNPSVIISNDLNNTVIDIIEFIPFSVEKVLSYYKYNYVPRHKIIIKSNTHFSIDIRDFELTHIINNNYMKKYFSIICNIV